MSFSALQCIIQASFFFRGSCHPLVFLLPSNGLRDSDLEPFFQVSQFGLVRQVSPILGGLRSEGVRAVSLVSFIYTESITDNSRYRFECNANVHMHPFITYYC